MIWQRLLADLIVVVHASYFSFVVLGLVAILLGIALRWNWVRSFWFRLAHLAAIGFVVFEAAIGMVCPLTAWENQLREAAGQEGYPGDFIGYWAHQLIFYRRTLGHHEAAGPVRPGGVGRILFWPHRDGRGELPRRQSVS